jgi:hypothetical protein
VWIWYICWSEHVVDKVWPGVSEDGYRCDIYSTVYVGLDITLFDALHTMHNGKFLHLPIVDQGNTTDLHFVTCDCIIVCGLWLPCYLNWHVTAHALGSFQQWVHFCLFELFLHLNRAWWLMCVYLKKLRHIGCDTDVFLQQEFFFCHEYLATRFLWKEYE